MKKYLVLWIKWTQITSQIAFTSRLSAAIFIIAKLLRYGVFLFFLLVILGHTKTLSGYTFWEVVLFFATFNVIDTTAQFFFREVYRFRNYIVSGSFDFFLAQPISPLFRSLFGGSDILDIPILFLSFLLVGYSMLMMYPFTVSAILLYAFFLMNAIILALSIHIAVLALGVLTTAVDNAILFYRDATAMTKFPVDIYKEPVSFLITFVIPVGIMMSFPAKAFLGTLSLEVIAASVFVSGLFLVGSFSFWRYALRNYSSASS